MNTNYNARPKTLGRQTAILVSGLYDRSLTVFRLADVEDITGLKAPLASSLVHKAVRRGLFTRLKGGLFTLVPQELGSTGEYAGNPFLVGRHLAGDVPAFISHGSAMEIHRMVTQPLFVVYVSGIRRRRNRTVQGTEYHFVLIKPEQFFGTAKQWISKQEAVEVSDLERTVIDGLRQPDYCGGMAEVARGLWIRRDDVKVDLMIDYSQRLGVGAVTRRLGYLLELFKLGSETALMNLQRSLSATYVPLDPSLPREGPHTARWRLQLNIGADELAQIRST